MDDFDYFLHGCEKENQNTAEEKKMTSEDDSLQGELKSYMKDKKMSSKEKLLPFWGSKKTQYRRLYKIAAVFHQIPVTEVSVERLFSHVKFILNPLRSTLSASLLDDILLIRLNFHLFEKNKIPILLAGTQAK